MAPLCHDHMHAYGHKAKIYSVAGIGSEVSEPRRPWTWSSPAPDGEVRRVWASLVSFDLGENPASSFSSLRTLKPLHASHSRIDWLDVQAIDAGRQWQCRAARWPPSATVTVHGQGRRRRRRHSRPRVGNMKRAARRGGEAEATQPLRASAARNAGDYAHLVCHGSRRRRRTGSARRREVQRRGAFSLINHHRGIDDTVCM